MGIIPSIQRVLAKPNWDSCTSRAPPRPSSTHPDSSRNAKAHDASEPTHPSIAQRARASAALSLKVSEATPRLQPETARSSQSGHERISMSKLDRILYSHVTALQIHRFMQRNLATTLASPSRTRSAPQTSVSTHDAATLLANALRDHTVGSREFRNASEALEFLSLEGVCAPLHFVTSSQGQCRRKGDIEAHLLVGSRQVSSDFFSELDKRLPGMLPPTRFRTMRRQASRFYLAARVGLSSCAVRTKPRARD